MINDIIHWVADKIGDQRSYPRKSEPFAVSWIVNGEQQKPATGVEISANGLVFQMKERPAAKELNLAFRVRSREVKVRVAIKRVDRVPAGGIVLHRFACAYQGIAADDWDAIVRFVNDVPEPPEGKVQADLQEMKGKEDDAYRMLPLRVQNRIVQMLVAANRLEPPREGHLPVLRLHFIGSARQADGTQVHRINIHSRRRIDDHWYAFDTQFQIDGSGNVEQAQ